MRVFDDLSDVREYFIQRADAALATIERLERITGPGQTKRNVAIEFARGTRFAYLDAAEAMDEIRPGFGEALEKARLKATLKLDEG